MRTKKLQVNKIKIRPDAQKRLSGVSRHYKTKIKLKNPQRFLEIPCF